MLHFQQLGAVLVETSPSVEKVSWTWPPYIIVPLVSFAILYVVGAVKLGRRNSRLRTLQVACFALGSLSLLLALDSPMHELSEQLFWVHMTQHEILVLVSAPLLVLARPLVPMLWAFPEQARSTLGRISTVPIFKRTWVFISAPVAAWLLHAVALWLWHAPALFIATLHSDMVHAAQHISFLGSALLFWWALLENRGGRFGYGGAILYVFTTAIHTSLLGAWLTFSPRAWYTPYEATAPAWNLTALQDQQLGGLIMWVPAGALLTVIGLALLIKFLAESERRWDYTRTAELIRSSQGVRHET
jgi:putative membrane protein